jgi:hypothetical protein
MNIDIKEKYPHLYSMFEIMAADNGGRIKSPLTMGKYSEWTLVFRCAERAAAKLSAEEKETVAAGEESEQQAIVREHGMNGICLDYVLNNAFDGELHGITKYVMSSEGYHIS